MAKNSGKKIDEYMDKHLTKAIEQIRDAKDITVSVTEQRKLKAAWQLVQEVVSNHR